MLIERLKEEEKAMSKSSSGPPEFPQTVDNWKLTPMSDQQFSFIYISVLSQRQDKARKINERADGDAMPEIPVEQIPVLTWASPKEFERLLYYAKKMKDERDEARLIAGALHGLSVKRVGQAKVNQVMQDALLLNERLVGVENISPDRYPPPPPESQRSA